MMLKKIIILGLTALFMTACGSNDSGGVSSSRGSGECVDVASPEDSVGLTQRIKTTVYRGGKIIHSEIESNELESFTKSSRKIIVYDDKENKTAIMKSEHSISNGLLKVTSIKVDNLSGPVHDHEYISEPYSIPPYKIGENCKGDTWGVEYDPYILIDGQKIKAEKIHSKNIIEDINVEKTVTAGTFNTVKIRREDLNSNPTDYSYHWIDIDTGFTIFAEDYENEKLISKFETLDIY